MFPEHKFHSKEESCEGPYTYLKSILEEELLELRRTSINQERALRISSNVEEANEMRDLIEAIDLEIVERKTRQETGEKV